MADKNDYEALISQLSPELRAAVEAMIEKQVAERVDKFKAEYAQQQ